MSRRLLSLLIAAAFAPLVLAAPALGKSLTVTDADVSMRLAPDSSLLVRERLTIEFEDFYEAAYRDIGLNFDEEITNVRVDEGGRVYGPGGCTSFGCTDRAGVFGVTPSPDVQGVRIVWHPHASDEQRTFTLAYRVRGGAGRCGETSGTSTSTI
jgi:hypothetical protein